MKHRILIVDDDPINLKLFTIIADKHKWSYRTATDGYQVQKMLEEQDFELVLLDIQLPGLDGYSLLKIIKEKYPNTAVIAVTAYAMSGDREKILRAGADDYVSKPVNIEELVDKIGKNLGDI